MGCGSSVQVHQDPDSVVPTAPSAAGKQDAASFADGCRLRIFHINDVYALDNLPVLRSCILARSEGVNVLTTLAGDFLAPSLLSSIDHGRGMVAAMNAVPIDAVCFGNHECDIPFGSLVQRINEFEGTWLNSNMLSMKEEPELREKLVEHHLVELEGGRSVVLTGFLIGGDKFTCLYRKGAFGGHATKMKPVLESVDEVMSQVHSIYPEADCVIPLTHQDMPDDVAITNRGHNFPVVLGGHDHDVFCEHHNGTIIVKAGADAKNVAVIDLFWEKGAPPKSPPIVSVEMVPLETPEGKEQSEAPYQPDLKLQETVRILQRPAEELKAATLAAIPVDDEDPLTSEGVRFHECSMATLLASGLRDVGGADGALMNAGSIRGKKTYSDGRIRFADLASEVPFPSTLITAVIPGSVLSEAVAASRAPWHGAETPRAGAAAGSTSDALHFDDGMKSDPITEELVEVAGKPLDPDFLYSIVIDNFLMHNDKVLMEYAKAHPENIPSEESGRPALPMLVEFFCNKIWASLCDVDGDGVVQVEEIGEFFDLADTDGNGESLALDSAHFIRSSSSGNLEPFPPFTCIIFAFLLKIVGPACWLPLELRLDVDEIMVAMSLRLGDLDVTKVLAQQCLSLADEDGNGKVSKEELRKFMTAEAKARLESPTT